MSERAVYELEILYNTCDKKIVIIGVGKIGKIIANFLIQKKKDCTLEAFLVDDGYRKQKTYRNVYVYEMTEFLKNKKLQDYFFLNTVTSKNNKEYREHLSDIGIKNILDVTDANVVSEIATKYWLEYFENHEVETCTPYIKIGDFLFPNPFLETVKKDIRYTFVSDAGDLIAPLWLRDYSHCDEGPYETRSVMVQPDDVVIDCGANIGISTANAIARGCRKVYAIEPVLNESLVKCQELFGKKMSLHLLALSDYKGTADIYINPEACNDNSIYYIQNTLTEKRVVNVTTLDAFVLNQDIQKIDYIKFYIDDSECRMLLGAKETIMKHTPDLAIFPYLGHNTDELKKELEYIIKSYNADYIIEYAWNKLFAYIK